MPLPPEPVAVGPFRTIARQQKQARAAGSIVCPVHNEPWEACPGRPMRIRQIRPDFWQDERVGAWSDGQRLFYEWLAAARRMA